MINQNLDFHYLMASLGVNYGVGGITLWGLMTKRLSSRWWLHGVYYFLIGQIEKVLNMDAEVKALADELFKERSLLVMGRGYNFATCLEGALVS